MEATIVVSCFCMIIAWTILLGFYGHDRAIMKSMANDLALKGALWVGRYVSPMLNEVDYNAMKQKAEVSFETLETDGYMRLQRRLLYGKVQSVRVSEGVSKDKIHVEIVVNFKLWKVPISCTVQSSSRMIKSEDLPRKIKETGEEK